MIEDSVFIVVALIGAAILGFIIGYYSKGGNKTKTTTVDNGSSEKIKDLNVQIKNLEEKLKGCEQREKMGLQKLKDMEISSAKGTQASSAPAIAASAPKATGKEASASTASNKKTASGGTAKTATSKSSGSIDKAAAKEAMGKNIKLDDLKIVEGIGPKIESILKKNNISTWLDLSKANADNIKEILLKDGGESYRIHEPKTWPKQAKMAADGKWKELKTYQDKLKGGKEVG